jgi:hypothetical protein
MSDALALLLGKAVEKAAKGKGLPEDLLKAVSDFRSAPSDTEAAEALVLAVQLASENGNSDLSE